MQPHNHQNLASQAPRRRPDGGHFDGMNYMAQCANVDGATTVSCLGGPTTATLYKITLLLVVALCECGGGGAATGEPAWSRGWSVGRPCTNPGRPILNGVAFESGAPDCAGNLCLITAPTTRGLADHMQSELALCTGACTTDADCASARLPSAQCSRLVCAVPSVVPGKENFCCQKLCMCQEDLTPGLNADSFGPILPRDDHGVAVPIACVQPNACMF